MSYKDIEKKKTSYRVRAKAKKERNRKIVEEIKVGGCQICGEKRFPCLDFHHVGDNKEYHIALLLKRGRGLEKLREELDKCIVVCANCHRITHDSLRKIE
jgi:hypothetical protein